MRTALRKILHPSTSTLHTLFLRLESSSSQVLLQLNRSTSLRLNATVIAAFRGLSLYLDRLIYGVAGPISLFKTSRYLEIAISLCPPIDYARSPSRFSAYLHMSKLIANSPGIVSKLLRSSKMPAFTLYGSRGSTNTDRVRLTLAEGGFTDYELVILNLLKGEQKVGEPFLLNHDEASLCVSKEYTANATARSLKKT